MSPDDVRKIAGQTYDLMHARDNARIAQLEAALKAVEWSYGALKEELNWCRGCWKSRREGHAPECLVGRALANGQ